MAFISLAEIAGMHVFRYRGDANAGLEACLVAWHEALLVDGAAGSSRLVAQAVPGQAGGQYRLPNIQQECRLPPTSPAQVCPYQGCTT